MVRDVRIYLEVATRALRRLRRADPALFARIPDGDHVVAFRNVLAHGYATLDHGRVFEIAVRHAPPLLRVLDGLLAEFPEGESRP